MTPPKDIRSSIRAPVRLRVDYERMNAFFADYTKNISKGGTFIKTPRPLPAGARCQFSFTLPALSDPLVLEGEVVRVETGAEAGMAIRFVFKDGAAKRDFEELVERLMEDSLGPQTARALLQK